MINRGESEENVAITLQVVLLSCASLKILTYNGYFIFAAVSPLVLSPLVD